jgi:formate dehydrogenase subunit delta
MANQIAAFFAAYPEAEGVAGVEEHLLKFWDPLMRRELLAAPASQRATLHPLVLKVLERLARAGA